MAKKNNNPITSPACNSSRAAKDNDGILRDNVDADELSAVSGGTVSNCLGLQLWMLNSEDDSKSCPKGFREEID